MQNNFFAKVGARFGKEACYILFLFSFSFLLISCAASNVTRDAEANVDLGVRNAKNLVGSAADVNISDTYFNSSNTTKGAIIGAATGAAISGGVGVVPGAAAGLVFGSTYGTYLDANTTLEDQIINRGGNVIALGDQILIAIPSARIFSELSPNIKPQAYSTLNLVSRYLNCFNKILIRIAVYTNCTGSESQDLNLSKLQAEAIERFLIKAGIDARILYADGYGGTHQVVKNTFNWDSDNYRIEITLEKLYA